MRDESKETQKAFFRKVQGRASLATHLQADLLNRKWDQMEPKAY